MIFQDHEVQILFLQKRRNSPSGGGKIAEIEGENLITACERNEKNKETILRLKRKIEIIEKRLAGSNRARSERQRKAQLKSV